MLDKSGALFHIDFGYVLMEKTVMERLSGVAIRLDDSILQPLWFPPSPCFTSSTTSSSSSPSSPFSFSSSCSSCGGPKRRDHVPPPSPCLTVRPPPSSPLSLRYDMSMYTKKEVLHMFLHKAATWYLHALPHADLFCLLWRGLQSPLTPSRPALPPRFSPSTMSLTSTLPSSTTTGGVRDLPPLSPSSTAIPRDVRLETGAMAYLGVPEDLAIPTERLSPLSTKAEEIDSYQPHRSGTSPQNTRERRMWRVARETREGDMANRFNELFDRHTPTPILRAWFVDTMRSSVNKYHLTDVTRQVWMATQRFSHKIPQKAVDLVSNFWHRHAPP